MRIGLIPCDGIGKEVIPAAAKVLHSVIPSLAFLNLDAGFELFKATGDALPEKTTQSLRKCDGALFGSVSSPSHRVLGYSSPIVALRKQFDLFANIRPVKSSILSKHQIDLLIVRENTECLYIKQEELKIDSEGLKITK
jgi:homoisocitrate dehydrogenase